MIYTNDSYLKSARESNFYFQEWKLLFFYVKKQKFWHAAQKPKRSQK